MLDSSWEMRNILSYFGVEMERLKYSPGLVYANQIYFLDKFFSRLKLAYLQSTKIKCYSKRIAILLTSLLKSIKASVIGYYYFKGGSPDFIDALSQQCSLNKVLILKNKRVLSYIKKSDIYYVSCLSEEFKATNILHGLGFEGNGKFSTSYAYTLFLEYLGPKNFSSCHYLKFLDRNYLQRYSYGGKLIHGNSLVILESCTIDKNNLHDQEQLFANILSEFCQFYNVNSSDFRLISQRRYNTISLLGLKNNELSIRSEVMNTKAITYKHLSKILNS